MFVVNIFLLIVFSYLAVCAGYAFIFSLGGRIGKLKPSIIGKPQKKFAVMLPSYKEDAVILHSAQNALQQNYPSDLFDVIVIADNLQPSTITELKNQKITVIEVQFEKSTKAKSLNEAFRRLPEVYDFALILDADNLMEKNFLAKLNGKIVETGVQAIQGHRVAKNHNTRFAILDAISEEVNNHIYRKGHRLLGLSSGLIGSGMAFDYKLYKEILITIDAVGGFDKESELKLLREGITIEYAEDALLYDEKVENAEVFGNQRKRWISAQIHYFKKFFVQGIVHLVTKGNVDFFDKAFQQFLMPRVLLLGSCLLLTSMAIVGHLAGLELFPGLFAWLALCMVCFLGIFIAVPTAYYNKQTLKAIMELPKAMIVMFLTLFKLKGANKKFIHTPHSVKDISI